MGLNLERWRQGVFRHDEINPTHSAHGIGLAQFDMDRLDLDEGEELWSGITVHADGKGTGNFRVLCDGQHDEEKSISAGEAASRRHAQEDLRVVGIEA